MNSVDVNFMCIIYCKFVVIRMIQQRRKADAEENDF
jgi:hypothetical protein